MKTTLKKLLASVMVVATMFVFALPLVAGAQTDPEVIDINTVQQNTDVWSGNTSLSQIIGQILNIIFGFLGVIAVLIILWGGFVWMTAGGEQDKVDKAKKMIYAGIIGLVIIFAAYAIAMFVMSNLSSITGTNVTGAVTP